MLSVIHYHGGQEQYGNMKNYFINQCYVTKEI